MGVINLPSLSQKIKVDTSDMKAAEAAATKFGTALKRQAVDSEKSIKGLQSEMGDLSVTTDALNEETKKTAETLKKSKGATDELGVAMGKTAKGIQASSDALKENAKQTEEVGKQQKKTKKSTEDLDNSFAKFSKNTKSVGTDFGKIGLDIGKLKLPAFAAAAGAAAGAVAALGAAAGAVVAQFGPMVGVAGAALPIFLALKTAIPVVSAALKDLKKSQDKAIVGFFDLNNVAKERALVGITAGIKSLGPFLKVATKGYKDLGDAIGETFAQQARILGRTPGLLEKVGIVFDTNARLVRTFGFAIAPIARTLVNITVAATPLADRIALAFAKGAGDAANFTDNIARLTTFFNKAGDVAASFLRSMRDIGIAIKNTFSIGAKAIGIDFVGGLESGAAKMRAFTESADGIKKIQKFFADAGPTIRELGLLIKDIAVAFVGLGDNQDLAGFIKILRTETLPAVVKLADGVNSDMLPAIANLLTAFAEFNSVLSFSPLIETVNTMAQLATSMAQVVQQVPGLGELVATLLLIKTSTKALSVVGNASGITGLVEGLGKIGPAGTAGAKGIGGFVQGLRGATGETKTFSNILGSGIGKGFKGAADAAKAGGSRIVSGIKAIGPAASTAGSGIVKGFAGVGKGLAGVAKSSGSALKTLGSSLGSLATLAGGAVKAGFASLVGFLPTLATGFKAAATAAKAFTISLLTNPVFLIIAAIIALIAAIVLLWKNSETFRKIVTTAWEAVKSAITTAVSFIVDFVKNHWQLLLAIITGPIGLLVLFIKNNWETIKSIFSTAMTFIGKIISTYVNMWVTIFKTGWSILTTVFTTVWNVLKTIVSTVVSVIATIISTYINIWKTIITTGLNIIKAVVSAVWGVIKTVIETTLKIISTVITTSVNIFKTIVTTGFNLIKTVITTVMNGIKVVISTTFAIIQGVFKTAISIVSSIVSAGFNVIKTVISTAMTVIKTIITTVWNLIKTVISTGVAVVRAVITGNFNAIPGIISGAFSRVLGIIRGAIASMLSAITGGVGRIVSTMASLPGKIVGALGNLAGLLFDKGKAIVQGLIDGITRMLGPLQGVASKMAGVIAKVVPGSPVKEGPLKVLNRGYAGGKIVEMLQDGIINAKADPSKALGGVFDGFSGAMKTPFTPGTFPAAPQGVGKAPAAATNTNNARTYNVTVNETTGPSTQQSLTDRLQVIDTLLN